MFIASQYRRAAYLLGVAVWMALVAAVAVPVVTGRHFQVDEFQVAYNSVLLFSPGQQALAVHPLPYSALLGLMARPLEETSTILLTFRAVFFLVLVINLLLAAHAQSAFPTYLGRWWVLVAFSFLFPLWTHGIEIRGDNLVLTGSLALFLLTQRAATRGRLLPVEAFLGGVAAIWTVFSAHKGFAYGLPYAALLLLVPTAASDLRGALLDRARLGGWLLLGATAASGVTAIALLLTGTLGAVWRGFFVFAHHLENLSGFSVWRMVLQPVFRYPHLFALSVVFLGIVLLEAVWRRPLSLELTADRATAIYLIWSLVVLWVNPKPYPYNLLHFLPFVFFAALAVIARLQRKNSYWMVALVALILANLFGWMNGRATSGYANAGNQFQLEYIAAAEALTDRDDDSILDGVGMVLTRDPPDPDWLLHGSHMAAYKKGQRTSFVKLLQEGSSPVVFTNYRWRWLGRKEWSLLRERYLSIATDFWVLGGRFTGPEGNFETFRSGNYFVAIEGPEASGEIRLDGNSIPRSSVQFLGAGGHRFAVEGEQGLIVSWAGPYLEQPIPVRSVPSGVELVVSGF